MSAPGGGSETAHRVTSEPALQPPAQPLWKSWCDCHGPCDCWWPTRPPWTLPRALGEPDPAEVQLRISELLDGAPPAPGSIRCRVPMADDDRTRRPYDPNRSTTAPPPR